MKKIIDKEYVKDNIAQLMMGTSDNEIVMDSDEILLLKVDGKVIINKYLTHKKRKDFPYADIPMHEVNGVELYNVLFEVDRNYLVYELGDGQDNIIMNRFTKVQDDVLWNHEVAPIPDEDAFEVSSYTREEMEKIFDSENYDALYIIDTMGKIMVASTKKDGAVITTEMLPSKEIELEMRGKSAAIYGGLYPTHMMITVKNGVFKVCNFSLTLDGDGKYVMDSVDVLLPDVSFADNLDIPSQEYERTGRVSIK